MLLKLLKDKRFLNWLKYHFALNMEVKRLIPDITKSGELIFRKPYISIELVSRKLSLKEKIKFYLEDFWMFLYDKIKS